MVHIVSILNLTCYETQVNRQRINIILKELTKSNKDIGALFNITNQLATQVQVQNIVLHLRAMLTNLRDCLYFMKQLANHVCSVTSQHFHLPPKYEDTHITMNLSIYNANLDIINISSALFRITQHIPSVQQQETLERLAALPPVPIKRITMELMGEVLQETLLNDKPFWLRPFFLMGCIGFVVSIMSTVACITKKKVAAWKPPALTGFLSLCRKDKNNTKMDDEDMDGPIYQPSGIILTVTRPQESHGLCVIPQPV